MPNIGAVLSVAACLFIIGAVGVVVRRNAIVVFMCIEIMLNAVNLTLVALSRSTNTLDGQMTVFFVMVVAAAEASVGLAIVISAFRLLRTVETPNLGQLKG